MSARAVGRLIPLIALLGFLAACATPSNDAAPKGVVIQQSKVAVAEPCSASVGPKPTFPDTPAAIAGAPNIFERAKLYASGRQIHLAYESKLEAAVSGCKRETP